MQRRPRKLQSSVKVSVDKKLSKGGIYSQKNLSAPHMTSLYDLSIIKHSFTGFNFQNYNTYAKMPSLESFSHGSTAGQLLLEPGLVTKYRPLPV